uniref:DUF4283 domain-containing protein n=1 Tax=Chenopodium quinoa TaxID=63459 RepID=A0A803N409_CHEQI
MEDDIIKEWEKLSLTEEESKVVGELGEGDDLAKQEQIQLALVGKLCTLKPFNVEAMKKTLTTVWKVTDNIIIRMMDTNLFIFQFLNQEDKQWVIDGMPWFFDGKLMLLGEINGDEQPSDVDISRTPMWVRLFDVPFNKRTPGVMREVGDVLGGFIDFDEYDPLVWGEFVRIKVFVDIKKPLHRGLFMAVGGSKPKWIDIKYEQLDDFCFYCGCLDHTDKMCARKEEDDEKCSEIVYQYGPWLRASPMKTSQAALGAREKEKKLLAKISSCKGSRSISYNDAQSIKLGPIGAARKLQFTSPPSPLVKSHPKEREASLMLVYDELANKMVLRPKNIMGDDSGGSRVVVGIGEVQEMESNEGNDTNFNEECENVGDGAVGSINEVGGLGVGVKETLTNPCSKNSGGGKWERKVRNLGADIILTDSDGLMHHGSGATKRTNLSSNMEADGDLETVSIKKQKLGDVVSGDGKNQVEGYGAIQPLEEK